MFGWYRSQLRTHGYAGATALLGRVAWARGRARIADKVLPPRVRCPCCGWQGRAFHDYVEMGYRVPGCLCPRCESHPRHRALFLWVVRERVLADRKGLALVFAPEKALAGLWSGLPALRVCRVDVESSRGTDMLADIQQLGLATGVADLIWCHHVIEHVRDDGAALRELTRVLRPDGGQLIISVPMHGGAETQEYGAPDPRLSGHWRTYGDDFRNRLEAAGLDVQEVHPQLGEGELATFGIVPESYFLCARRAVAT